MEMEWAVDIPDRGNPEGEWINMGFFDTEEEAIAWVAATFGGDRKGRIGLVSRLPNDGDGD